MPTITVTMAHEAGLHARPLAKFVKTAKQFDANVEVSNVTRDKGPVSATSPIKLMLLAVSQGHIMEISAEGPQADEALQALQTLIENNFEGDDE